MIPLAFAAVFLAGRSALDETGPAPVDEASTQVFDPTVEPTEEVREATLAATPEPTPRAEPANSAVPAESPSASREPPPLPEPPGQSPVGAVAPPRIEVPADRTSCSAITGSDYRLATERSWYLANCARKAPAAPPVARTLSTPARATVVKPTAAPQPVRNLYSVSARLCSSGVVRYPAFTDAGIVYGTCTSDAATVASTLPRLTCAGGYVLIPSVLQPGAIYCYATPSVPR